MPNISDMPAASTLTGAEQVPMVQGGTTVRATVANLRIVESPLSLKDPRVGAILDGVADDTAAITMALALMPTIGGRIYHPGGIAKTTSPIVYTAAQTAVVFMGSGRNSARIVNAVSNVFNLNAGAIVGIAHMEFRDIQIEATAGHMFAVTGNGGIGQSLITHCNLVQNGPSYSVWHQPDGNFLDNLIMDVQLVGGGSRTVPMWYNVSSFGAANANTFMRMRTNNGENKPVFHFEETSSNAFTYDNTWRDINVENGRGGFLRLLGGRNCIVENVTHADIVGSTVGDLIYIGKSAVAGASISRGNILRACSSRGAALGAGFADIRLQAAAVDTTRIEDCEGTIDLGSNNGTILRTGPSTTVTNPGPLTYRNDSAIGFERSWTIPYGRPAAATAGAGGHVFDTTLNKPIWSDGTNWRLADGTLA